MALVAELMGIEVRFSTFGMNSKVKSISKLIFSPEYLHIPNFFTKFARSFAKVYM